MLTRITLENFKVFNRVTVYPKQITILTGPNGGGKSSILQALMLLKQTSDSQKLRLTGPYIKLDSFQSIRHSTDNQKAIIFHLEGKEVVGRPEELFFMLKAGFAKERLVDLDSDVNWGDYFAWSEFKNRHLIDGAKTMQGDDGQIMVEPQLNLCQLFVVSGYTGNMTAQEYEDRQGYLVHAFRAPGRLMENMEFVPANRGFGSPTYKLEEMPVDHFEITKPMHEYESDVATTLAYRRDQYEEVISDWMAEITGIRIKAPVVKRRLVDILATQAKGKGRKDIKLVLEGFGSNQLLFILLPVAQGLEGSILIIEEPELHLHPTAQSKLTRRLLKECKAHRKQLIMTTHSEHITASVLTSIAEETISNDDVAIYYLAKRRKSASAKLLEVDSRGRVKGGLPGFFDAGIEEAERHLRALGAQR